MYNKILNVSFFLSLMERNLGGVLPSSSSFSFFFPFCPILFKIRFAPIVTSNRSQEGVVGKRKPTTTWRDSLAPRGVRIWVRSIWRVLRFGVETRLKGGFRRRDKKKEKEKVDLIDRWVKSQYVKRTVQPLVFYYPINKRDLPPSQTLTSLSLG